MEHIMMATTHLIYRPHRIIAQNTKRTVPSLFWRISSDAFALHRSWFHFRLPPSSPIRRFISRYICDNAQCTHIMQTHRFILYGVLRTKSRLSKANDEAEDHKRRHIYGGGIHMYIRTETEYAWRAIAYKVLLIVWFYTEIHTKVYK